MILSTCRLAPDRVFGTQPGQFIEIYNPTDADLDVTGWVVKVLLFQPAGVTTASPYQQAGLTGTVGPGNVLTVCLGLDPNVGDYYCCCDNLAIDGNVSQFDPRAGETDPGSHIDRIFLEDSDGITVDRFGPT